MKLTLVIVYNQIHQIQDFYNSRSMCVSGFQTNYKTELTKLRNTSIILLNEKYLQIFITRSQTGASIQASGMS